MSCGWRRRRVFPSSSRTSLWQREIICESGLQSVSVMTVANVGAVGISPRSSRADRLRSVGEGSGIEIESVTVRSVAGTATGCSETEEGSPDPPLRSNAAHPPAAARTKTVMKRTYRVHERLPEHLDAESRLEIGKLEDAEVLGGFRGSPAQSARPGRNYAHAFRISAGCGFAATDSPSCHSTREVRK